MKPEDEAHQFGQAVRNTIRLYSMESSGLTMSHVIGILECIKAELLAAAINSANEQNGNG